MSDVDFSALSRFSSTSFENANTIANLDPDNAGQLTSAGTYGGAVGSIFRSDTEKANNNAVRTELLKSLGQAFHIEGMEERGDGKVTFNKEFMDRLGKLFGADLKQEDFGIAADGSVASGRPLTQRRISAIISRANLLRTTPEFSLDLYAAKTQLFTERFNSLGSLGNAVGKTLTQSLNAAVKLLRFMDMPDPNTGKPVRMVEPLSDWEKVKHGVGHCDWVVHLPAEPAGRTRDCYVSDNDSLDAALKTCGFGISCDAAHDGRAAGITTINLKDQEAISRFNSDLRQKLQNFVKTACDAWIRVEQGEISADKFLDAYQSFSEQRVKKGHVGVMEFVDTMQEKLSAPEA